MTDHAPFVFRWGDELGVRSWARAIGDGATVVLHDGADERWLLLDAPERFASWAATVAAAAPACRSWISIRDLNVWPIDRYVGLRTLATGRLLRAFDHQLAGHVLAREVITRALPGATVVAGIVPDARAYELATLLDDVLAARDRGVGRSEVGDHLRERKAAFEREHPARTPKQRLVRRLAASALPLEQALPRALGAVYAGERQPVA
jgi:hypothetical protein